ncbi:MAG: hypothetical protein AMJ78_02225 [Omnitrophica WOR_2 bacterium SM23_29]|nr:MAG: hypothetical protein AMJ78_02225 [Omnitrophica WOR_2 bacterium SM23_29]
MSTYKKLIDLVSRRKVPKPSEELWQRFDKELMQKLDAIDAERHSERVPFIERIKEVFGLLLKPGLKPVLVTASLLIIIIGMSLYFTNYRSEGLVSVAALSNEEAVEEFIMVDGLIAEMDALERGADINGIFNELELFYEPDPSLI